MERHREKGTYLSWKEFKIERDTQEKRRYSGVYQNKCIIQPSINIKNTWKCNKNNLTVKTGKRVI